MTYSDTSTQNESFWINERFNHLLIEARADLDENRRAEMYAEAQRILRDDGGSVISLFNNELLAVRETLAHGEVLLAIISLTTCAVPNVGGSHDGR